MSLTPASTFSNMYRIDFLLACCCLFLGICEMAAAFSPRWQTFRPQKVDSCLSSSSSSFRQKRAWDISLQATPSTKNTRSTSSKSAVLLQVNDLVGSGSYGCVHLCSVTDNNDQHHTHKDGIGKRSWTLEDLSQKIKREEEEDNTRKQRLEKVDTSASSSSSSSSSSRNSGAGTPQRGSLQELTNRCRYYWRVEQHCFKKLPTHDQIPVYQGTFPDTVGRDWMLFDIITDCHGERPAPSLLDLMKQALADDPFGTDTQHHHLHVMEQALGLEHAEMGETLDIIMESLLQVLTFVHSHQIVHRDIKPGNILVTTRKLILLDFGSAADLEPISRGILKTRVGMEDGGRVAISPIYAAPEVFIDIHHAPTAFDVFSAALLVCQLLFRYFDERTDAGFHQQLREVNYSLDDWLRQEIVSKVRPSGLEDALEYLGERPGLWRLLGDMLRRDPTTRPLSSEALERFQNIVSKDHQNNDETKSVLVEADGPFFQSVIESMENCATTDLVVSRPLHFVASFRRSLPLGLVLSEAMSNNSDDGGTDEAEFSNSLDFAKWKRATAEAYPGQVFIKEISPGGQADELGIFEVGDELQGVGELPLLNGGFERAVQMLQQQPRSAKFVTLHFDRLSTARSSSSTTSSSFLTGLARSIQIVSQGAWSSKGRRETQEDSFVLHEIHDSTDRSVLLAGVMDGHAGTAAATLVAEMMPNLLSEQLFLSSDAPLADAMAKAWDTTCQTYRQSCQDEEDSCEAIYDPREGKLFASTGSERWPAGTTTSLIAVDEGTGEVCVLNCGDSRSLLISNGTLMFASMDHTPDVEVLRFVQGQSLGYSMPTCRMSKWQLKVGEYVYAVSRSLEGQFATSKGVISDPDITSLQVQGADTILVVATDGLWEVMDSQEVTRDVARMKQNGLSAASAAKNLCAMALEKGSADNISVVVVYLE